MGDGSDDVDRATRVWVEGCDDGERCDGCRVVRASIARGASRGGVARGRCRWGGVMVTWGRSGRKGEGGGGARLRERRERRG